MTHDYQSEMPSMILRRLRPATLSRPLQTHTHFHLAPRLNFTVSHTSLHAAEVRVEKILHHLAGERLVQREELVQRIVTRGMREEAGRSGVPGQESSFAPALPARGGVPAVLLRATTFAPAVGDTPSVQAAPKAWPPPVPKMAPMPDLERISEQVIRTIDRRLQAHRERTGRV